MIKKKKKKKRDVKRTGEVVTVQCRDRYLCEIYLYEKLFTINCISVQRRARQVANRSGKI